jgi:cobalt-zinc-cadmium resistance protein CzcA
MLEQNRRFDIVVRLAETDRENLETIRALPVRVGESGILPLGALADIQRVKTVSPILRDSAQRRAALMVSLRGRDVESWVREDEEKVRERVKCRKATRSNLVASSRIFVKQRRDLRLSRRGARVHLRSNFHRFGSVRQALLVYSGVPLAVTGGVIALWLRSMPFSISAAVGFIALSGVAVLNGVVMVSYFNQLREERRDVRSAVIEGSLTRLRPVLMTAAVAAFGFIPMALSTSAGAEVQRPLATVVIGGITSSTFLTLVLLPVLYEWAERKSRPASGEAVTVTAVAGLPATSQRG